MTHKAAEQGDAKAQLTLAEMYNDSRVAGEDAKQAVFWARKAAEQGYLEAQLYLTYLYGYNEVVQDAKQAVYWARKAAEQGDAEAQHNLGLIYITGQFVAPDLKQAYIWNSVAAANGHALAAATRDSIAKRLTPAELEAAQETAARYFEQYKPN